MFDSLTTSLAVNLTLPGLAWEYLIFRQVKLGSGFSVKLGLAGLVTERDWAGLVLVFHSQLDLSSEEDE